MKIALAALTLQGYYRFLPTYQPIETKTIDQKSADDVVALLLRDVPYAA